MTIKYLIFYVSKTTQTIIINYSLKKNIVALLSENIVIGLEIEL